MNKNLLSLLAVAVLLIPLALRADFLTDNTMQEGLSVWKGDGEVAYLNADGTEGQQGDQGVTQCIKITLSKSHPRYIYQDYTAPADLAHLNVTVEVYASFDFKRSKFPDDYSQDQHWTSGSTWYWSAETVPNVDFWMRGAPGYQYKMQNLKVGQWNTVKAGWDPGASATDRAICFFVPAGEGAIYIRKATATQ
ncbi:MAG TPA: hypothetical protein VHY09_12725 [Candidatus Methylacidiphilales bacterium]|jgi:hypothetical protein|nr:hypothetical protein [Candidatus Methylacidiphilales bacterium]